MLQIDQQKTTISNLQSAVVAMKQELDGIRRKSDENVSLSWTARWFGYSDPKPQNNEKPVHDVWLNLMKRIANILCLRIFRGGLEKRMKLILFAGLFLNNEFPPSIGHYSYLSATNWKKKTWPKWLYIESIF